jgi:phosphoribosylformylglycinamidine cyclo-ligase
MAHITGGGLLENIPRVLPKGAHAMVDAGLWDQPRLMAFLQAQGAIEPEEMARTFNCGVGMVLAVEPAQAEMVRTRIEEAGDTVLAVGEIVEGERGCTVRGAAGVWSARADWEAVHNA